MALTIAQIHSAASAIDATGQKPSLTNIRAKLGSGSYSTIKEALLTWEKPNDSDIELTVCPDEVSALADVFLSGVWDHVQKVAALQFEDDRQSFQDQLAEALSDAAEAGELFDKLDAQHDELKLAHEAINAELALVHARTQQLEKDLITESNLRLLMFHLAEERLKTIEAFAFVQQSRIDKPKPAAMSVTKHKKPKATQGELVV